MFERTVIDSFLDRVPDVLPWYTARTLGAILIGDELALEQHRYRDMVSAYKRLRRLDQTLNLSEQAQIAAYFLPIIAQGSSLPVLPVELLPPLLAFVLTEAPQAGVPAVIEARVSITPGVELIRLEIRRNGQVVGSVDTERLIFTDVAPVPSKGVHYTATATFSNFTPLTATLDVALSLAVYAGIGPGLQTESFFSSIVSALPTYQVPVSRILDLSFIGNGYLMFWIPGTAGTVATITSDAFGSTDLRSTFQSQPLLIEGNTGVLWTGYQKLKILVPYILHVKLSGSPVIAMP